MTRFDKQRWTAVSPMLDRLLDAEETTRATLLADIGRENSTLAAELAALLAQHARNEQSGFLEKSPEQPSFEPTLAGQQVGSYTLDRPLGRGGMGEVWLARRSDGRYVGTAAIKFLNLALFGLHGIERFKREGNALARLAHPNIARLIDAGVTHGGHPYLVLEHVDGEAIDRWCEARSLDVPARLRLFLQVLASVAHAHSKLILHRDLKPSNILVTPGGEVKLLDFGIAKLMDDDGLVQATTAAPTQAAGRGFTPEYAAPEQVQGTEVSTATDVYALGVLLYTLLTGQHPTAGSSRTPMDILRAIVDTDPRRPSKAVAGAAPRASADISARALRGDLDNIVAKALKKAPADRYQTAEAMLEDLRRHLENRPISARPDSLWYRAGKFVARNRTGVAAAALTLVAILAAAGISLQQAHEAALQRDRARALLARNDAVIGFISDMLTDVAPSGRPVLIGELLERSQSMNLPLDRDPEHQAVILNLIADYFLSQGEAAKAEQLLTRSLDLTRGSSDAVLRSGLLCRYGYALAQRGAITEARTAAREGSVLGVSDTPQSIRCLQVNGVIAALTGDWPAAIGFAQRARARLLDSAASQPGTESSLLHDVAFYDTSSGNFAEADHYYQASLAKLEEIDWGNSPRALRVRRDWALSAAAAGDFLRSLKILDDAIAHAPPEEELPVHLLATRAIVLLRLARLPEAIAEFDRAIEKQKGNGDPQLLNYSLAHRAAAYFAMGDTHRAQTELALLTPQIGKNIPPLSQPAIAAGELRAQIDERAGRLTDALAVCSQMVDDLTKANGSPVLLNRALLARAEVYIRLELPDAALADARRALDLSRNVHARVSYSSRSGLALATIARIQQSRGEYAAARATAEQATAHLAATLGESHPDTLRARAMATGKDRNPDAKPDSDKNDTDSSLESRDDS